MRLTRKAIESINKTTRLKLALALDVTEQSIIKYIAANDEQLTLAAAIQVLREETGLPDKELLEQTKEQARV